MRLHRKHIGAVQQILVGVGIIGFYAFYKFILAEHGVIVVRWEIGRNHLTSPIDADASPMAVGEVGLGRSPSRLRGVRRTK
jgi:hypothetical protein